MTFANTASAKTVLRLEARARRKALMVEHPEADWMAADRADELLSALKLDRPGVVAIYKSLGSELDPRPLGEALRKRGWTLALPAVETPDSSLTFRGWAPGEPLGKDLTGLPSPLPSAPELTPDLVLVPLIAFDREGGRLGQGGGHYDRTLEALAMRARRPPFIGFAYSGQQVARIPSEDHDQRLDGILTEAGYIPAERTI